MECGHAVEVTQIAFALAVEQFPTGEFIRRRHLLIRMSYGVVEFRIERTYFGPSFMSRDRHSELIVDGVGYRSAQFVERDVSGNVRVRRAHGRSVLKGPGVFSVIGTGTLPSQVSYPPRANRRSRLPLVSA